jgi:hypothetical protein
VKQLADLAATYDCPYYEVSAKNGTGIQESVYGILKEIKKYNDLQPFVMPTSDKKPKPELYSPLIPPYLNSRTEALQTATLVNGGQTIAAYNGIGTYIGIKYDGKELSYPTVKYLQVYNLFIYYDHTAATVCRRLQFPILVSLHKDDLLRVIHLEDRVEREQHTLEPNTVKEVQCIMLDESR